MSFQLFRTRIMSHRYSTFDVPFLRHFGIRHFVPEPTCRKFNEIFLTQFQFRLRWSAASREVGCNLSVSYYRAHLLCASFVWQQGSRRRLYARVSLHRLDRKQSVALILSNLRLFYANKSVVHSSSMKVLISIGRACDVFSLLQILFW